jgi:phenylacetate-CoA ligase
MRDNFLDHCADDIDPAGCLTCTTSGSTGIPLKVIHDREHLVHSHALALRRYLDYGLPFDRKVLRPFHQHADTWREHTRLGAGVVRLGDFGFLDAFGKAQRCEIARRCVEFRPDVSFTHPSRMIDLVRLFHEFGQWMSLTAIAGTGEVASNAVRQELSTFFEAPFYALYGLSELSTVASECEFGSLHIESERLWVEIVDDAGTVLPDGAEGEIVVTNLFNSSAPFIRYRTGDLGALGTLPCPCGRPQKVLRLLVGRQLAQIVLPGGERWDALRVVRVVDTFPVKRLQVIQESRRDLVVLVDPLPQFTRQTLVAVHDAVHTALDGQLMVRVEVVTDTQFHHRNQVKNVNFIPLGAT